MASVSAPSIESLASRLRAPGYLILIVTAVLPVFDFASGLWPLHMANPAWRFGVLGLLSNYSLGFVGELFLIFVLAIAANDRKVLVTLGIVSAIMAVLLLIGSGGFVLDALQTRARVTPQTLHRFDLAAVQGLIKLLAVLVSSAVLSRSSFKAGRRDKAAIRPRGSEVPVVVTAGNRQPIVSAAQQES